MENDTLATHIIMSYEAGLAADYTDIGPIGEIGQDREYLGMSGAGRCQRQLGLSVTPQVDRKPDSIETKAIFKDGYLFEADTVARLRAGGLEIEDQQQEMVHDEFPEIKGHHDGLIRIEGEWVLLEIKSMRSYPQAKVLGTRGRGKNAINENVVGQRAGGFTLASGVIEETNQPYWAQVQVYLRSLDLRRAAMVCRFKETGQIAVEIIERNDAAADGYLAKLANIMNHVQEGMVLPADHHPGVDWQCNYCDYLDVCDGSNRGLLTIEQFLEVK